MLTALGAWILANTQWLYMRVVEGPFFFFDLWSLNHAWSGCVAFLILRALGVRRPWFALVAVLLAYEVVELGFIYAAFHVFKPETLKDQLTDIAVGIFGASVGRFFIALQPKASAISWTASVLAAVSLSFVWVGGYGYTYSWPALNSPGINWWAWLCWSAGLLITVRGMLRVERSSSRTGFWASTAAIYATCLFSIEALGFAVLGIREVGHVDRQPLAFDLIHGTRTLHFVYAVAPVVVWFTYRALRWLLLRATSPVVQRLRVPALHAPGV